jgi:pilus assembly protein CpaB
MNSRSMITMAMAVVIGLIAMIFTRQMLTPGGNRKDEETQDVLVAARDLKVEELLKPELVKVVKMARSAVPAYAFSSAKDIADRWVKTPMLEDDVLVEKKLGPKGTPPGLVANIPPGMRAFAIDVTEQSGVSGFVLPGHHVDVIRFESGERSELHGDTILQDVLVLAAGQLFSRPEERSVASHTVTLALKPDEVDILVAARAKGALSLALRGVNDHDQVTRRKPAKPAVDPEHEKRWKLAEEKRARAEQELETLKRSLAAKIAEPPAPRRRPTPRVATIYRGIHNVQRIRTDHPALTELEPDEPELVSQPADARARGGATSAQIAATDGRPAP